MLTSLLVTLIISAEPVPSRVVGGVMAPAVLPAGSNALYGVVGAPDLGVGYRQGFDVLEFEARAWFNLFELSATAEAGLKFGVLKHNDFMLAPLAALGLKFNSGSRYFGTTNFGFVGLRPRIGVNASYAFSDIVSGIAQLEIPWTIALGVEGFQITPLVGAGAEFHLGGSWSMLLSAHVGFEASREPLAVTQYRAAWAARLGLGYRLF